MPTWYCPQASHRLHPPPRTSATTSGRRYRPDGVHYPEGTSIPKELVQNDADDAGAREVRFCVDARHHPTEGLGAYAKLAPFQGPALLAYNSAPFTDVDFASIQRIGDSLKKAESKGGKTGRFGVGFNSVYHLTDLPAYASGTSTS